MELVSRPILTDPSRYGTEVAGPIECGEGANLIVSPYEVPDSMSVFWDRKSQTSGIRFTYIVDEPTEKRILSESLHAEIGRKSARIYSLVAKYSEEANVRLSNVVLDGFSRLEEMSSSRRRTPGRADHSGINMNFRLVKRLLKSNASRIDNLNQELKAIPT
jgi:hypothetical protein